ncbi:hypothetical protein LCY76_17925 [Fictibacillus sp. KIGAM418]|uniref:Uncharacterized protein n=1 Tax=Fictibacillus marinisediminis TaxID=2878389 RepID=A0A9X1XD16_9BACL|nr:hypothetical protein [Fictibacillus marinisediminis]MCK6258456.1 hypothetical protein [Fictibacillus marinisediminis]
MWRGSAAIWGVRNIGEGLSAIFTAKRCRSIRRRSIFTPKDDDSKIIGQGRIVKTRLDDNVLAVFDI